MSPASLAGLGSRVACAVVAVADHQRDAAPRRGRRHGRCRDWSGGDGRWRGGSGGWRRRDDWRSGRGREDSADGGGIESRKRFAGQFVSWFLPIGRGGVRQGGIVIGVGAREIAFSGRPHRQFA